jgi:anti-sigma factor (TIGR02949 family)
MSMESARPAACGEVRERLAALLAGEVDAAERDRIRSHLDACGACLAFGRFEAAFDAAIRRAARRARAPEALLARIRGALDAEAAPARRARRAPPAWLGWAAAAAILAGVLVPGVRPRSVPEAPPAGSGAVLTGTLVCGSCERHGVPLAAQRGCSRFGHHAALRCDRTGLWEIVETEATRGLTEDRGHLGDRIEVRGALLDDLRHVRVDAYSYLPASRPGSGL